MKFTGHVVRLLSVSLLVVSAVIVMQAQGTSAEDGAAVSGISSATQVRSKEIIGVWSGTFESGQKFAPFTMTVTITKDAKGHLIGDASHDSGCFTDTTFHVTVDRSRIVMAGSDKSGNNITLRGTLDHAGTQLTLKYIVNGSTSGRCESDTGRGTMGKR